MTAMPNHDQARRARQLADTVFVRPKRQRGFALLMGLIFLIMLSIIAVVVMKNTVLEAHLTTATARHEEAFEASEMARRAVEAVLKPSITHAGGWPATWLGGISDAEFGLTQIYQNRTTWISLLTPSGGMGLQYACGGTTLINVAVITPCSGQAASYNYTPSTWQAAFKIALCSDGSSNCTSATQINATVSIIKDGSVNVSGCNLSNGSYNSASAICTVSLLHVRSKATVLGGVATTNAQFKVPNQ